MNKNKIKEITAVFLMLLLVCFGYKFFYNKAFSGYDAQGWYIWLSGSTVKFVNNWLKEGPVKLKFIMYEYPDSIEFNSTAERSAYISYPPGAIVPPYILAKLLLKNEIQLGFIKQLLKIKFLFDTLLVCLIMFSTLRITLGLKYRNMIIVTSIVLAISWMCFPTNLYYLRNVYFSDQCIISVVLFFILLEIYHNHSFKKPLLKYLYLSLKFIVALYGVLTDYYFLFVLFVSWLTKIIPMIRSKDNFKNIFSATLIYVLPVLLGLGLFFLQISIIPDYLNIILGKAKARIYSGGDWQGGNKLSAIYSSFIENYSILGVMIFFLPFIYVCIKVIRDKQVWENYGVLLHIMAIIYISPVLQVLVLQQHSAVHEFSMLKFALPIVFTFLALPILIFDLKKNIGANFVYQSIEDNGYLRSIRIPFICLPAIIVIISSILFSSMLYKNDGYYTRIDYPESYEREDLIRSNYSFNDVYFSFTESIAANPPQYLAISKKLIYRVNTVIEIFQKFPYLNMDARTLLIVNDNNSGKSKQIMENEQDVITASHLLFSSENYSVYEIPRPATNR